MALIAVGAGLWAYFGPEREPAEPSSIITDYQMELLEKGESVEDLNLEAAERRRKEMEEQGI